MNDLTAAAHSSPEQVVRDFLTPRLPKRRRTSALHGGETLRIATKEGEIALQRAGTGPAIMLLHGWEGRASDLAAFAPPLLKAGYTVLAMDLPAHGASAGQQSSVPQSARALHGVGEALGPLHAVIAHSMGSAILAEALYAGLAAQRAVLISAPAYYESYARNFAVTAGLDSDDTEMMLTLLCDAIDADVREISVPHHAPYLHQPALFIHSTDDPVIAIEDSLASASAWPGARHLRVEGLGHKRILADQAVVAATIKFVTTFR